MNHPTPTLLADWLALIESRTPEARITPGLERATAVWKKLNLRFDCPVITVGGTNGKGSTCAMLEAILLRAGYRVGLHTSPHLLAFNERARIDGEMLTDAPLAESFAVIEAARDEIDLSYFEFTLLAILHRFAISKLDAVILEVGLGGRLDATNIIDADVAIVTSIALDHTAWLGDTREAIGFEKAGIFRTGKPAICADPQPPATLIAHAQAIGADLWLAGRDFHHNGDRQQWNYAGCNQKRPALAYPALRGANQLLNASAALAALEALQPRLPVSAQAVRSGLAVVELPGRFQVLPGRPAVVLDVAHNPHAAAVLADNLDNMGFFPRTYAVFGAMADKDITGIVKQLAARIDHWYLATLPSTRAAGTDELTKRLTDAGVVPNAEHTVEAFDSVANAYRTAHERAVENDRIAVFGSFLTVAGVIRERSWIT